MTPMDEDDAERPTSEPPLDVALPSGATVERLGPDLALISLVEPRAEMPVEFSAAEREVAQQLFDGLSNAEIAAARGVSTKTVNKQVAAIYRKLGVASRAELVLALGRAVE